MPETADIVDQLRRQWGHAETDALLRRSMRGDVSKASGGFYVAELGADGQVLEFGATIGGRRCVQPGGEGQWVDAAGRDVPAYQWYTPARVARPTQGGYPLLGSSQGAGARVIRASSADCCAAGPRGLYR